MRLRKHDWTGGTTRWTPWLPLACALHSGCAAQPHATSGREPSAANGAGSGERAWPDASSGGATPAADSGAEAGGGVGARILAENNVFVGVKNPIDSSSYADSSSVVISHGNVYSGTSGTTADKGGAIFTPGYAYTLDPAATVQSAVLTGAGPH